MLSTIYATFIFLIIALDVWSQVVDTETLLNDSFFKGCSASSATSPALIPEQFITTPLKDDKFYILPIKPSNYDLERWHNIPETITSNHPNLAMGLMKAIPQARMWTQRTDLGWTVTSDHPRNNRTQCVAASQKSSKHPIVLYKPMKALQADSFLLKKNDVLIHETGIIAAQCGYYQAVDGCETKFLFIGKKWWKHCQTQLKERKLRFRTLFKADSPLLTREHGDMCRESSNNISTWQYHDKVFVATALWDSNYHHFLVDTVLRFIRHLDFLKQHPEWKIHIRRTELTVDSEGYFNRSIKMREKVSTLLGLDQSQFISGAVIAKEVVTTRGIKCNMFIHHAMDLRFLAEKMIDLSLAKISQKQSIFPFVVQQQYRSVSEGGIYPRKILIQHRICNEDSCSKDWRGWTDQQFLTVIHAFRRSFPYTEILSLSDSDSSAAACLHCEIAIYKNIEILVGEHGAGVTNLMFMKPGTLLMEIIGVFDGRMLPLCGYHGPLAAIFGVHHLIHYYDWKAKAKIGANEAANRTADYYQWLQQGDRSKPFPYKQSSFAT